MLRLNLDDAREGRGIATEIIDKKHFENDELKEENAKLGKQIDHLRADVNELVASNTDMSSRWKSADNRCEAAESELCRMKVAHKDYKAHMGQERDKIAEKSEWFDKQRDKLMRENYLLQQDITRLEQTSSNIWDKSPFADFLSRKEIGL